jgi:cytochrome P450/deferrochelatase/peroxidase EfeB
VPKYKYVRLFSEEPGQVLPPEETVPPFDFDRISNSGLRGRLFGWVYKLLLWPVLRLLQWVMPVGRFGRLTIITRDADVRAILADPVNFPTPFGPEMRALADGEAFLLGLDGPPHERQKRILIELIEHPRDLELVARLSSEYANALLDAGKGQIDAQRDLITRTAAEVCARYFGFGLKDPDLFAQWTIAASNFLFADPTGKPVAAELASAAGAGLRALADRALAAAAKMEEPPDTLAGRLVRMGREPDGPSLAEARAILIGLAVGFVPTNALAGGKMLAFLSRHKEAHDKALKAARSGDDAALRRILLEAGRLDPALAPGQWRWCPSDTRVQRADGSTFNIDGGSVVLVSTMAALRDPRIWDRPGTFRLDRAEEPELLFGHLFHTCVGRELAMAQIAGTIAPLLQRREIERSLRRMRMRWKGPYPYRALLEYDDPARDRSSGSLNQNGVLFAIPLPASCDTERLNLDIKSTMDRSEIRNALDQTDLVHFLSLTAISLPDKAGANQNLCLLEINVDGPADVGAKKAIVAIDGPLRELLVDAELSGSDDLANMLAPYRIRMHGRPWGGTALNFHGVPDHSVRDISAEKELAAFAKEAVDAYQQRELGRLSRPITVLSHVRQLIRQPADTIQDERWLDLARRGGTFERLLLKPYDRVPALARWNSDERPALKTIVLRSALFWRFASAFLIFCFIAGALLYLVLDPGGGNRTALWLSLPWLALQSILATAAFFAIMVAGAIALLRGKEHRDVVDDGKPSLAHLRKLAEGEDLPGHVKNHITVVTPLKGGILRRMTLAFALWGIGQLVTYYYRPGFVLSMGTIQFARWVRLPGTNTMIFQSNYDGSWESYLEDFITRAHLGQTAVWSNCEGFPASRFLIHGGAENGDLFKHYVRRKQVPTAYWYSRFPDISAEQIRRHALIRDGLARARSDSEARDWLALFGSAPRQESEIESAEIQAIVFNGFGKLSLATFSMLRLPKDQAIAREWLRALTGFRIEPPPSHLKGLDLLLTNEHGELQTDWRVSFGETDPEKFAVAIVLSANGIRKLVGDDHPLVNELPGVFAMGMRERAERLGDDLDDFAFWHDGSGQGAVDVGLFLYSESASAHTVALHALDAMISRFGLEELDRQDACPHEPCAPPKDHFGFRDGMVQPVIDGSLKSGRARNPDDILPAGEMILGYRNLQGYYSPGIPVAASADPFETLPDMAKRGSPYPRFGDSGKAGELAKDFARNGSFMAIRVLEQDVKQFKTACDAAAEQIKRNYRHLPAAFNLNVTAEWVAAKMVGRWKNGSSLIANPSRQGTVGVHDYTLAFGRDDPRGLQCPFGSHIRRSNPRDSLLPGDKLELDIVNRHRLLRRGRNYERGDQKGLYFVAICADLERQFEFVQRNWINSDNFQALDDEADPLVSKRTGGGKFTIPTAGGSIRISGLPSFVSLRAGGYFFIPSKSALMYLSALDD